MESQGLQKLARYIPDLQTARGRTLLALWFAGVFTLATLFFLWTDRLIPDWQPDGQIVFAALSFAVLARMYWKKKAYQEKYGDRAYRNAIVHHYLPGMALLLATIAHTAYMPGVPIADVWWKVYLTALGWVCVAIGIVLWARGAAALGVERLAMLPVYYPEEDRLLDAGIFSVLRHPVLAGMLRLTIGLALLNDNWLALVFAVLVPLGPIGWTRLLEEKDLLERYPDYAGYRKRVWAFWPRNPFRFWRILFTGK
jgi:protein-S-isoprenylcysteine O-methyltransferase Ste14